MSLYPLHNDFEEDLAMIPEIADIATEQFLKDSTLSKLALEIRIEPRQMNRRRVTVRVAPKEDINMAREIRSLHIDLLLWNGERPGCGCERARIEVQRKRHLHSAFNKLKEHLVEMRPINPFPTAAQYSAQSFYEFGPTGSTPPMRSLSTASATTERQISTKGAHASFGHENINEHVMGVLSRRSHYQ
uniref:BAG domain-containing protein n=1 Tax=Ascaris lumbricoides TaxID=6252 RepID=A0A0M3IP61_ASCLU